MSDKIYLRRGLRTDIPVLASGEPGWCVDTKELFVGTGSINEQIYAPYDKTSYVRAYQAAPQSFSAATMTKVTFGIESADQLGEFDITNSRLTALSAGIYYVQASVMMAATNPDGNTLVLTLYVNGFETQRLYNGANGKANDSHMASGSTVLRVNNGDYIETYLYSTAAINSASNLAFTYFTATRIS